MPKIKVLHTAYKYSSNIPEYLAHIYYKYVKQLLEMQLRLQIRLQKI